MLCLYNSSNNSCEQAKLPYTTLYQESIGTTIEGVQFTVLGMTEWKLLDIDNGIRVMGMDASYSGIDGTQIGGDVMIRMYDNDCSYSDHLCCCGCSYSVSCCSLLYEAKELIVFLSIRVSLLNKQQKAEESRSPFRSCSCTT